MKKKEVLEKIKRVFDRYNYREDIELNLQFNVKQELGKLWGSFEDAPDEILFGYKCDDGYLVVLVNYIDCKYYVFEEIWEDRI